MTGGYTFLCACGHNRSVHRLAWDPAQQDWDRACLHEHPGPERKRCACNEFQPAKESC